MRTTTEAAPLFLRDMVRLLHAHRPTMPCAGSLSLQSQIHYFFEGLGHSPPLEEVHLLINMAEPWPAQALLDAFKGNRSLKTIHLSGAATSSRTCMHMDE